MTDFHAPNPRQLHGAGREARMPGTFAACTLRPQEFRKQLQRGRDPRNLPGTRKQASVLDAGIAEAQAAVSVQKADYLFRYAHPSPLSGGPLYIHSDRVRFPARAGN